VKQDTGFLLNAGLDKNPYPDVYDKQLKQQKLINKIKMGDLSKGVANTL
jgi:hypothetical protein